MSPTTQAHTFMLDDFLIREAAEPLRHKLDATLSMPWQDGETLNLLLAQIYQDIRLSPSPPRPDREPTT